jgi:RNA polymerase sigma-70 factor (ECF subfamily)
MTPTETLESYRPLLFSIAYQMTGSASEAEDIVQDTFVRYQQTQPPAVQSLKAYLTTITTRLAIDYLRSARHLREQYVGTWLPEPVLTDSSALLPADSVEQQEAISLAFLILLETLTPPERAVFLLHEVFDYPFEAIAPIVAKSVAACRQIFHRAQEHIAARKRRFRVADEEQRALVARFLQATQEGQIDTLLATLAHDATLQSDGGGKARAVLRPLLDPTMIARFFLIVARKALPDARVALREVNYAPALLIWENDILTTVFLFEIDHDHITGIYGLRNPDKLAFLKQQLSR